MTTSTKHISNIIDRIRTCVQLNNEVHEMVKNDKLNLLIKKKKIESSKFKIQSLKFEQFHLQLTRHIHSTAFLYILFPCIIHNIYTVFLFLKPINNGCNKH